jgi:hypothetical protein
LSRAINNLHIVTSCARVVTSCHHAASLDIVGIAASATTGSSTRYVVTKMCCNH